MTNTDKLALAKARLTLLSTGRGDKNFKSPGVVRKIKRQIRNLEKKI